MRMMVRWTVPVERGNQTIKDGTLGQLLESLAQDLKAEAAYYWPEDGKRAGMMVFDMADSSEIPRIAEQLFLKVDASVQLTPVMNADDLKKALAAMSS